MPSPADYLFGFTVCLTEILALVSLVRSRSVTQYFPLFLYLTVSLSVDIARFAILETTGLSSPQYRYFYYYSDALLTIVMFFVLMNLYARVFDDMGVGKYLRGGALLLLAGTACISYYMVNASSERLFTLFALEISQNLYFVGVLLTYVLWGTMVKMRENRSRVTQLVLSLGVFFSASAANFAVLNLHPQLAISKYIVPLMALWLPVSWSYTFTKVSEDARIITARVLAPNR
jgi:hypothetical protein